MKTFLTSAWLKFRSNLLGNGLKVLGVCGACFVFEACYGTPQGDYPESRKMDIDITGRLKTEAGVAVKNTEVCLTYGRFNDTIRTFTDNQGVFGFYNVRFTEENYHLICRNDGAGSVHEEFAVNSKDLLAERKEISLTIK